VLDLVIGNCPFWSLSFCEEKKKTTNFSSTRKKERIDADDEEERRSSLLWRMCMECAGVGVGVSVGDDRERIGC